ncbi:MAG: ABC transporter ATP-binding protein [Bacteroidota bacterium]|nr:ABC transporter ATP-binding protein [Bacteroidota bacterium]
MNDPDIVIRTENLTKRFGRRAAVDRLNLEVLRGDVFGFLGPNGAGKSTTIRMILSLIRPSAGYVELFGHDIRSDRSVYARVGGLVEKPDFYSYLSARKNLEIVQALYGVEDKRRIGEVLEIVGLADRASDRVKSFSHGMKQRLGIAQALLTSPELIILDEPTSGLDPQGMKEVRDLIRTLNRDQGKTIFLSSHLLYEIEMVATRMCILHRGEMVAQGEVNALLNKERLTVRIHAEPRGTAIGILRTLPGVGEVRDADDHISCTIPEERLAAVNAALVREGIAVSSFAPRRSLEDFFLSITERPDAGNTKA